MKKDTFFTRLKKVLGLTAATGWVLTNFSGCGVYGPPTDEPTQSVYDTQEETEEKFDPSKNNAQDVYGPPPVDADEDENSDNEDFEPQINENAPLYGPPPEIVE